MNSRALAIVRSPSVSIFGAAVLLLGVAVLFGWAFDNDALKRVISGGVGMKANTAVGFVLCGIAVLISGGSAPSARRRRRVGVLAVAVAVLGGLSLAEELLSRNFGIDELLFRDPGSALQLLRPGRMSPASALCFIMIAAALAMSALPERLRLQLPLAAALSASVAVIGAMFLAGHISHRFLGTLWGTVTTMAVHTSLGFLLLGIAGLVRVRHMQSSAWALGRAGTAGFIFGLLLMLGSAELAATFAQDMARTTESVARTQQTLRDLQEIRNDMRTLESAQRGHLILGDERFIDAREVGKASVRSHLDAVRDSPLGDVLKPEQLDSLRSAIDKRISYGDRLVVVRRTQGFEAARALLGSGDDVELTTQITNAISPMVQIERAQLAQRQQHLAEVTTTTFLLLPIGSFFGLGALMTGLFFLDHGFARRHRADEALGRSRAGLQVAFNSMVEGIRVVAPGLEIAQVNPAGATVHGLIEPAPTLNAIIEQVDAITPTGRVLEPDEWPAPRALRGEFVRNLELTFRRRDDGRSVMTEINTAPLPGEPGHAGHVIVTSHDVTERKRAQAAIRIGQERLEKVVENLVEGLLIHGLNGDQVHWNRAALRMYELPLDMAKGMARDDFQEILELSTPDGEVIPFEQWPMSRLMRGDVLGRLEVRLRRLDRNWHRVFSYEGALLHDSDANPLVFLTVTDVTARKTAEMQLQQLNAELEQRVAKRTAELNAKSKELESFCYSVSHDLKAPLRGIDGYSRLLADEYGDQLDDDARGFIDNVRKATIQMNNLIEDLLAYSRQERREMAPMQIRLREFVQLKLSRRAADLAGIALSVEVDDMWVLADREGLEMALRNLLDNAIKFSARSTQPTIAIRTTRQGDRCVLSVQDNGTGFDMRYYDRIFEIFQRLHRAEDYPGTGIGLALVRKAMERMGGRVWAQSVLGQGATFYLELLCVDKVVEEIT